MGDLIPFPCRNPRGEVVLYPCEDHDGSWAVDHVSRSGDSVARIGAWLAYGDAERAGREYARRIGADFSDGAEPDPEPRGAA